MLLATLIAIGINAMRIYIINAVIFTIFTKEPPVTFVGTGIVFREKKIRSVLHKS